MEHALKAQIEKLKLIVATLEEARTKQHTAVRAAFIKSFLDEFLSRWQENPPREYHLRPKSPEESLDDMKRDIERAADKLFEEMVQADRPQFNVIYKDIALEDLADPDFTASLREVMKQAGVQEDELDRLLQTGSAVPEKGAFRK